MNRSLLLTIAGVVISVTATQAHHSIAGAYDTSRQVSIEGVITQFHFVNPHPYVTMEVKDVRDVRDVKNSGGVAQQWRLEMDNRSELAQVGMTSVTLRPGDRIVVTGSPARTQPQSLYIRKLDRPADGFQYEQVGSSPRIRAPR